MHEHSGGKVLQPGDRSRGRRQELPQARAAKRGSKSSANRSARTSAPANQTNGCVAATPVKLPSGATGRIHDLSITPGTTKPPATAATSGSPSKGHPETSRLVRSAARSGDMDVRAITDETVRRLHATYSNPKERKQISGVVGISDVAHEAVEHQRGPGLSLLALVSLSLGLINLLPFLPLDGGHIFWAMVEKLRGKPVSLRVMERASMIGFALVADADLHRRLQRHRRITGEGFNVRVTG